MLQLMTSIQQSRLVNNDDCATGTRVKPQTVRNLDLMLDSQTGRFCPAVVLHDGRSTQLITFTDGFEPESFFSAETRRDFQQNALVWFEQGEPGAGVYVMIYYKRMLLMHFKPSESLEAFMRLPEYPEPVYPPTLDETEITNDLLVDDEE